MTQEEKAKAYDDALERATRIKDGKGNWRFSDLSEIAPAVTEIFPELKESEDERVIKAAVWYLEHATERCAANYNGITPKQIITYLEKQKEQKSVELRDSRQIALMIENGRRSGVIEGRKQVVYNPEEFGLCKPAEWSEEEKRKLNRIYQILGWAADTHAYSTTRQLIGDKEAIELQDFLRSIAKPGDRPAGWSEEDEKILNELLDHCNTENATWYNWLKSLRYRLKSSDNLPKWKKASAGTKLSTDSVILYEGDHDPRIGKCAINDCIYIPITDLLMLDNE